MKSTVLIIGFSGFVGPYLAHEFLSHDYNVVGFDIKRLEHPDFNIPFYEGSILNKDTLINVFNEVSPDIVINLAAISSVTQSWYNPKKTFEINVCGSINILDACIDTHIFPKIMFVGSSEEYMESKEPISENYQLNGSNPYGISKMAQEMIAKAYRDKYNLNIYCVRSFNHSGLGQNSNFVLPSFCKQVIEVLKGNQECVYVGNINVKRDFSHVKDIVRAYRLILEKGNANKVYNVGSGVAYCLSDLIRFIISLTGKDVPFTVDESRVRPNDYECIVCDNSLLKEETGWEPEFTIFDALIEIYNNLLNS